PLLSSTSMRSSTGRHGSVDLSAYESSKPNRTHSTMHSPLWVVLIAGSTGSALRAVTPAEGRFACILSNSAYLTVFPRGPHQEHQHYLMNNRSFPNLEERLKHAS